MFLTLTVFYLYWLVRKVLELRTSKLLSDCRARGGDMGLGAGTSQGGWGEQEPSVSADPHWAVGSLRRCEFGSRGLLEPQCGSVVAFATFLLVPKGKEGVRQCLSLSLPVHQLAALLFYHPCKFYCQVFMQSRKASLSDAESTPLLMLNVTTV